MIKVKKLRFLRQLISLASYQSKDFSGAFDFKLAIITDSQEAGEELAGLLSLNSQKAVPVFDFESLPPSADLLIVLLLCWNKDNLQRLKDLAKNKTNYLVISLSHPYLSLAFRAGREAGIPSHRIFVFSQEEDYFDFFKGALRLAGEKKFALAKTYPVFLPFLEELFITSAAVDFGLNAFRTSPSFFSSFLVNLKNLNQLSSFSVSNLANKRLFPVLTFISLPTSFVQIASSRLAGSQNAKLVRALGAGLSTFLAYRLITSSFFKKKV